MEKIIILKMIKNNECRVFAALTQPLFLGLAQAKLASKNIGAQYASTFRSKSSKSDMKNGNWMVCTIQR